MIAGSSGDDVLRGLAGWDLIGGRNDLVLGGNGRDVIGGGRDQTNCMVTLARIHF